MENLEDQVWAGMVSGGFAPESLPSIDIETGTELQLAMLARYLAEGEELAGYKVGLTSGAARDAFGPGVRPFGYILKSRIFQDGDNISRVAITELGLENELVFKLGADLMSPDVDAGQARDAVDSIAPGFEINENRVHGRVSPGVRIAENLSQWGLVTGKFVSVECLPPDLEVIATHESALVERVDGRGHIDDHFESIAALARSLYARQQPLVKDMLIITGSYTRFQVTSNGTYKGDFGPVGQVSVNVA